MTGKYDNLIRSGRSGVYVAPKVMGPLRAAAKRAGIAVLDLDLDGVAGREAFFQHCAAAFSLPGYFGQNWDALQECMFEFAGRGSPGVVVHWRRGAKLAGRAPEVVNTALEILQDAATYWGSSGRVFLVLLDRDSAPGMNLPPLR